MAAEPERSILERRLVIVTGKGGTGKTTVSAALALAASRAGMRVLAIEVGRVEHLPRLLERRGGLSEPVGYAGRKLQPGLTAMRIDPFAALAEYLGLQLRSRPIVDLVVRNRAFRQLMEAAPGWRELITLGKVWHLEQMQTADAKPLYDLIVVDAPASGHGVTFLDVPRVTLSAVRAGPLRRHAGWVEEMIHDRERTLLLPVALAEELPTRETVELVERLRDSMGIAVDRVVVNAVASAPLAPGMEDLGERLAALPANMQLGALPGPVALAACVSYLEARWQLNRGYLTEIGARTGLPVIALPYLAAGIRGLAELDELGSALVSPSGAQTEGPSQ
jgi:anion-transporting  ArsA/GET3 family ATPase